MARVKGEGKVRCAALEEDNGAAQQRLQALRATRCRRSSSTCRATTSLRANNAENAVVLLVVFD
eukprot:354493-Chlamydomonas_euryale.AAC.1